MGWDPVEYDIQFKFHVAAMTNLTRLTKLNTAANVAHMEVQNYNISTKNAKDFSQVTVHALPRLDHRHRGKCNMSCEKAQYVN